MKQPKKIVQLLEPVSLRGGGSWEDESGKIETWHSECYANQCFFRTDDRFCLADKRWDGVDECRWQDIPGAPYACVANDSK